MKKTAVIISAIFYLFLSIGIRVNAHYCGDQVSSVDLFFDSNKNCCGKEELAKKCCKDKVSYLKLSNDQQSSSFFFSAPDFSEVLVPAIDHSKTYLFVKQPLPLITTISFFDCDVPLEKTPVYIVNRSFRV